MNKQKFIGIDLHQRTLSYCVSDKEGVILKEATIPTKKEDIIKVFSQYKGVKVALEPVTQYWCVSDWLIECGLEVVPVHPKQVKAIAHAKLKNDKVDARVLCQLLRANLVPRAYLPPMEQRGLKVLVRNRRQLVKMRTKAKNQVQAILWKEGIRSIPDKGETARLKARTLLSDETYLYCLELQYTTIDNLGDQLKEIEKRIKTYTKADLSIDILRSIPGIDYTLAAAIHAEVGNIERFDSPNKLQSFAGLVPRIRASGGKERHGSIDKSGSTLLRWALIQAAHLQIRSSKISPFRTYYLRTQHTKDTGTAAVATARKLTSLIWRLLTDKRMFEVRSLASSVSL